LPALCRLPEKQEQHEYLYREYGGKCRRYAGAAGRRFGCILKKIALYNLKNDIGEQRDVSAGNPDVIAGIKEICEKGRTESERFPLAGS